MTIFYVDLVNGSDAAAGTSWATAWKTSLNGPTAARISPGDEIRYSKSPDPTDVGTATWTNRKVGNSITFASAPTKVIDTMDSGFVTMGAGSTVTNSQATAYMMWGTTPGTGSTMQYVTSATTNGAYKNLGSVIDYSGYQQVCFWFRTTVALDCTGAQNFNVRLCSDTAGATPVNTLAMPKWLYAANTWYPIVIDAGSALGSSIQSISFNTTNATTQTFYLDELFASPAAGLTLWSLIEDNDDTWYAIRTIRDADVWLMASYSPTTSAGGSGSTQVVDTAWIGTTGTFTTRKRETLKNFGANGPTTGSAIIYNKSGTWTAGTKLLINHRLGFNTATNEQDGYTYMDSLICPSGGGTLNTNSMSAVRIENLVGVRNTGGVGQNTGTFEINKVGAIACLGYGVNIQLPSNFLGVWNSFNKDFEILSVTGCNAYGFNVAGQSATSGMGGLTVAVGNMWGNSGTVTVGSLIGGSTFNMKNVMCAATGSTVTLSGGSDLIININSLETPTSTSYTPSAMQSSGSILSVATDNNSIIKINSIYSGTPISLSNISKGTIIDIGEFYGTASLITGSTSVPSSEIIIRCTNNNSSNILPWYNGIGMSVNGRVYVQDYNGEGNACIFMGIGNTSVSAAPSLFELQTGDVNTIGSKAWKYKANGFQTNFVGMKHTIKLASVAAVANKLVTVTCYVKKNNAYQDVAIRVPAIFLPGYTSDITTVYSGTPGTFQQLTITFTPTADCVFDITGVITYVSDVAGTDAVWDDLSITQAP